MRALLVAALLLLLPGPAQAAALLAEADAVELANALAEAHEAQGVCYGWALTLDDVGVTDSDVGSHLGPGRPVDDPRARCPRGVVELRASITYTSEVSEAEDRASFAVDATPFDARRIEDGVRELGFGDGDLLSADDDVALFNMVGALPAVTADVAGLPYVPFEPSTGEGRGEPTGSPGSDFLRENRWSLGLGVVLVVGGLVWWLHFRRTRPSPPAPPATTG